MKKVTLRQRRDASKTTIRLAGSKSISNRLLLIRHLSGSTAALTNLSTSEDSTRLIHCLDLADTCSSSRIPMVVDAGNAGTVFRFLTTYLSRLDGKWLLTATERMLERPVGILVDALKKLNAKISYVSSHNYPPLLIEGTGLAGGQLEVDASVSSQFISSLMLVAPSLKGGLKLRLKGSQVSYPYILLTAGVMEMCGITVEIVDQTISIPEGSYCMPPVAVEPDWSSASYWYEIAALSPGFTILLEGLQEDSLQGDRQVAELFRQLGVDTTFSSKGAVIRGGGKTAKFFEANLGGHPDLAPALLATSAALGIPARLSRIAHLRHKESDRIHSLERELSRTGAGISVEGDVLNLMPGNDQTTRVLTFDTHKDHRIAMCLAPLALKYRSVTILDPLTAAKSYPEFWDDLSRSGLFAVDKM